MGQVFLNSKVIDTSGKVRSISSYRLPAYVTYFKKIVSIRNQRKVHLMSNFCHLEY